MPGIQALAGVDTNAAAGEFASLVRFFQRSRWDRLRTPFAVSPLSEVESYCKSSPTSRTPQMKRDLKRYIAASGPLHCADGWSYLGRAVDAHNRGDVPTSVHLGYYASLRAAMSLLATQSIGVFNYRHIYIDQHSGDPEVIQSEGGTHKFVWKALQYFLTNHGQSRYTLEEIVRPGGHSLREWLDEIALRGSAGGASIVLAWGLDLARLSVDQQTRNHVSYRPVQYSGDYRSGTEACTGFMSDLWSLSEPAGSSFWRLDRCLLRRILEMEFRGTGRSVKRHRSLLRQLVGRAVNQLEPSITTRNQWMDFLLRNSDPTDPQVLDLAQKNDSVGKSGQHLQVLSRSFLLLRLASGACARFLRVSGVSLRDLEFWWSEWGAHLGLWDSAQVIPPFEDLWSDVEDALYDLENGNPGPSTHDPSRGIWLRSNAESLAILGSCERIALWGLGL